LIAGMVVFRLGAQTPPPKPAPATAAPATPSIAAGVPNKVAILQFQEAILTTAEGQKAASALKARFDPKKAQVEKRQADLQAMQDKLQKGGATLDAAARTKLQNDIAAGGRALNHDVEDLNTEVQEEEGKIMQSMSGKMGDLIRNYATQNGYAVVLDVSGQQSPVLWAAPSVNITADIVKLYDKAHPVSAAAAPPARKQ
jgi:outer membrane protein